jgi:hypothetical protein
MIVEKLRHLNLTVLRGMGYLPSVRKSLIRNGQVLYIGAENTLMRGINLVVPLSCILCPVKGLLADNRKIKIGKRRIGRAQRTVIPAAGTTWNNGSVTGGFASISEPGYKADSEFGGFSTIPCDPSDMVL